MAGEDTDAVETDPAAGNPAEDAAVPPAEPEAASEFTGAQLDTGEPKSISPFRRRRILLLIVVIAALKTALLTQQLAMYATMRVTGCPDPRYELTFGPGGGHVYGLENCSPTAAIATGFVGSFIGLVIALPVILLFIRDRHPRNRVISAYLYLLAIGALAEVLAETIVFAGLGKEEAGILISHGVPRLALMSVGLAGLALAVHPIAKTTPYFATELLGHDEKHAHIFQKAIWLKLTVGVGVMALIRVLS